MTLAQLLLNLINAASDGEITRDEVKMIVSDLFPDSLTEIVNELDDALDDRRISIDEVIRIVTRIVS